MKARRFIQAMGVGWFLLIAVHAFGADLPPAMAPGAINPAVTQDNLHSTVCVPNWTKTVRPAASYTNRLKLQQMAALGLTGSPRQWEEDHRVPLSAGGHPTNPANLWPESWTGVRGARAKDRLEDAVHRDLCAGRITLDAARAIFLGDWWPEHDKRFGPPPG